MKLTQDFNLNEFPFYFLKKKRTLYLKNLYKKKRKYYYFLVSRRKSIKLFSKRYNLNYYLHYEHYHNERKILKYFYHFTMNTGLKKNQLLLKFKLNNFEFSYANNCKRSKGIID